MSIHLKEGTNTHESPSASESSSRGNPDATTDQDLVQLAGYHSYNYLPLGKIVIVNDKRFEVVNTRYDTSTGLDALTVQNSKTGEMSVVFVGSDQLVGDWINTNINLIGEAEPAQLEAAVEYYEEMEETFGEIPSVTGNSLGGALANRVAIDHPNVKSVTLNPAMLPDGMVDKDKNYENVVNYQSEYDVLTHVQEAINYEDRIPGNNYNINNGLPIFPAFTSNHTGYVRADSDGHYTIEIGTENQPGHGEIHVGADDHVVTSIWTGASLHYGDDVPIELNVGDIKILSNEIKNNISTRITLAGDYISHAIDIVEDESEKFEERVTTLQENLNDLLNNLITDPLLKGSTGIGNMIQSVIDDLISMLDFAEEQLLFLNVILNSPPAEFVESLLSIDVSVETIFAPVKELLASVSTETDNLIAGIDTLINEDVPAVFEGGKNAFVDAVVGELDAHYHIVAQNKESLLSQVTEYEEQVSGVADVFDNLDQDLGIAIATNTLPVEDKKELQETSQFQIERSDYLEGNLQFKEVIVSSAHYTIKQVASALISPILSAMNGFFTGLELALETALFTINTTVNVIAYNPVGIVVNLISDYIEQVKSAAEAVKKPIDSMKETTGNLITGIREAQNNLPDVLEYLESYIDVALFTPGKFSDVKLYNMSSVAILTEMEMLFDDIVLQLSNQKAKSMEATVESSRSVLVNIEILRNNLEKGAI